MWISQRFREFRRGFEPVGGKLFECLCHRGLYMSRHRLASLGQRLCFLGDDFYDDLQRRLAVVGWLAGEHLVQHARERVDVRARSDLFVGRRLLGAHVVRRA